MYLEVKDWQDAETLRPVLETLNELVTTYRYPSDHRAYNRHLDVLCKLTDAVRDQIVQHDKYAQYAEDRKRSDTREKILKQYNAALAHQHIIRFVQPNKTKPIKRELIGYCPRYYPNRDGWLAAVLEALGTQTDDTLEQSRYLRLRCGGISNIEPVLQRDTVYAPHGAGHETGLYLVSCSSAACPGNSSVIAEWAPQLQALAAAEANPSHSG